MSVALSLQQNCTVTEALTGNAAQGTAATILWSALNNSVNLSGTSTPPVSLVAGGAVALSSGAKTLDLTALTGLGTGAATVNMNTKKIVAILFSNPATNANAISMVPGASNGYNWDNSTGAKITLQPGATQLVYCFSTAPAIGGSAKTLDFAGTSAQPFNIVLVGG